MANYSYDGNYDYSGDDEDLYADGGGSGGGGNDLYNLPTNRNPYNPIYSPGLGGSVPYQGNGLISGGGGEPVKIPGIGSGYYNYGDGEGDGNGNDPYDLNGQLTFGVTGTGFADNGSGGSGGGSSLDRQFFMGRPPTQTGDPNGPAMGTDPRGGSSNNPLGGSSSTTNNTTNNYSASSQNVASENMSNAMPAVADSVPESNPDKFTPQYIPMSQRHMNPAGMDSGRMMPSAAQPPHDNPYDPVPSKSGDGVPMGGGRTMPTSKPPLLGQTLRDAALGLTGANRYRKLIQDVRKRPTQQPNPFVDPYGM